MKYPQSIGGRDTDISQIGASVYSIVRDEFPINKVPLIVENAADGLMAILIKAESELKRVIDIVREEPGHESFMDGDYD